MYKYLKDNTSVLTVLDARRARKSGLYPIKVQVVCNRIQKYYSTGKELNQEDWDNLPKTKSKNLILIREDIETSFERVKEVVRALLEDDNFSFERLNQRLGKANSDTINTAFRAKIEWLKESGSIGNMEVYTNSLNRLEKFAGDKVPFESVTVDWLKRYEKAMLDEGKSYTTISMYIRCVRAIFNEAIGSGTIKQSLYPFGKKMYEIPVGKGRKMALNLAQIKQIVNYDDGNEATSKYRDLWFFSYLANGINVNDMLKLKYSNIANNEITFYRSKTINTSKEKKAIYILLTLEMEKIIEDWGNPDKTPDSYIFPFLKGGETPIQQKIVVKDIIHRINRRMKMIGKAIGIDGISSYTARHSYATVLKRSGANIAYISESLGHSDLRTTENYLASFEREEREKNAKLLTNFE